MPKSTLPLDQARLIVFKTGVGWTGFLQTDETLHNVRMGFNSERDVVAAFQEFDADARRANSWERDLAKRMATALNSKATLAARRKISFADVAIDETWMTPFQRKVVKACRAIGFGDMLSYGQLAEKVKHSGAARAVGSVMSGNRYPIIVPCHRVISSAGLGGFSSPRGVSMKSELLSLEGDNIFAGAN